MPQLAQLTYNTEDSGLDDTLLLPEEKQKDLHVSLLSRGIPKLSDLKHKANTSVTSLGEVKRLNQLASKRLRSYLEFLRQFMCQPERLIERKEVLLPLSSCFGRGDGKMVLQALVSMAKFLHEDNPSLLSLHQKLCLTIHLQDNFLQDEHESMLLALVSAYLPYVQKLNLDLRHNGIGAHTIREIALKLEAVNAKDVRIEREGLIQATHASTGKPFVVIDFREANPSTTTQRHNLGPRGRQR